ncbi:NAD(P)-dependent glycerol-3-phosphate dehydrogenase [Alphaproteobacteria bacterium]|nr:NAD(P)-dependent glycerol-3-phosphate dehydrogenase [Alphaproteobacteria bacterium]
MNIDCIGILGAGAWGTALAQAISTAGHQTVLWANEQEVVDSINRDHENPLFLQGVSLNPAIQATNVLAEAGKADAVFLVVPAQFLRSVALRLAPVIADGIAVVVCAKGIEQDTSALMSEVIAETLPGHPIGILSGPTFAAEVAIGLPIALTLATVDEPTGADLMEAMGTPQIRPYLTNDVIGAEIGGAVKNILAIACGITEGRKFGDSARAAIITRGLAEMTRLCVAKGGRAETMMGLSGLGDLTLTCTSTQSRNYSLGVALGQGQALGDILASRRSVAEGVFSAAAVAALAQQVGVEMPIVEAVESIVNKGETVDTKIRELLARPFRTEAARKR